MQNEAEASIPFEHDVQSALGVVELWHGTPKLETLDLGSEVGLEGWVRSLPSHISLHIYTHKSLNIHLYTTYTWNFTQTSIHTALNYHSLTQTSIHMYTHVYIQFQKFHGVRISRSGSSCFIQVQQPCIIFRQIFVSGLPQTGRLILAES